MNQSVFKFFGIVLILLPVINCGTNEGYSSGVKAASVTFPVIAWGSLTNGAGAIVGSGDGSQSNPKNIQGLVALATIKLTVSGGSITAFSCTTGANWTQTLNSDASELYIYFNLAPGVPKSITCSATNSVGTGYYYMSWT